MRCCADTGIVDCAESLNSNFSDKVASEVCLRNTDPFRKYAEGFERQLTGPIEGIQFLADIFKFCLKHPCKES